MRTDLHLRSGQAAVEFAICAFIFALIVSALVGFSGVFLRGIEMLSDARTQAGVTALDAGGGGSSAGANAAAITARAHPPAAMSVGEEARDPWDVACETLPQDPGLSDWRANSVVPVTLHQGSVKKTFNFRLTIGGETLLEDEGHLSEEMWMPSLGGINALDAGGGP